MMGIVLRKACTLEYCEQSKLRMTPLKVSKCSCTPGYCASCRCGTGPLVYLAVLTGA